MKSVIASFKQQQQQQQTSLLTSDKAILCSICIIRMHPLCNNLTLFLTVLIVIWVSEACIYIKHIYPIKNYTGKMNTAIFGHMLNDLGQKFGFPYAVHLGVTVFK